MSDQNKPTIVIEKINLERLNDFYNALSESAQEWFAEGMLSKPDMSMEELEAAVKGFLKRWEDDDAYMFYILEAGTNQVLGSVFLNHVNRTYQLANLGYLVRTSRAGEGIATAAARLVAHYGFETLGFQRLEIVVRPQNTASLKVAEKVGAMREGLLRHRLQHHGSPCDALMHSLIPTDLDSKTA
jgi:RimJ/RimL family protein N-acetyltransferase